MEEQLISFKTAKLAKEKGFNIPTNAVYVDNGTLSFARTNNEIDYNWNERGGYSAPNQSLLQKWLREKCNINVISYPSVCINQKYIYLLISNLELLEAGNEKYNTYEEALEIGLREALKLI
jgi:hypothetical protein